jgi:hypothetical protein
MFNPFICFFPIKKIKKCALIDMLNQYRDNKSGQILEITSEIQIMRLQSETILYIRDRRIRYKDYPIEIIIHHVKRVSSDLDSL